MRVYCENCEVTHPEGDCPLCEMNAAIDSAVIRAGGNGSLLVTEARLMLDEEMQWMMQEADRLRAQVPPSPCLAVTNLRKEAEGRDCMVRSPECRFTPTTILAHLNGGGMGMKNDDALAAWSCFDCHNWLDGGYAKQHDKDYRDLVHLRGMARTIEVLRREGKLGD